VKRRFGFVSNSSSSSFTISLEDISASQLQKILDPDYESQGYVKDSYFPYTWYTSVDKDSNIVKGDTGMDNFSMHDYFNHLGVDKEVVTWE